MPPKSNTEVLFPKLQYLPRDPQKYSPQIALIGCGGITEHHLAAYQAAGYQVTALCDVNRQNAEKRKKQFYPEAQVFTDYRDALKLADIEVVDVTTHPDIRPAIITVCLKAGKHVLSQKPFVLNLDEGERLADLADKSGVLLAVNQNGRWAPHFSYLREVAHSGMIGDIAGVHCGVHWDHSWVKGTAFENVEQLILYDFAIHWFDFLTTVMGDQLPQRVYASTAKTSSQSIKPALLGQASIEYENAQATLVFDGHVPSGSWDRTLIAGSRGLIRSAGRKLASQQIELITSEGSISPELTGTWFPDGFHGTMGELLCAIEEKRQPSHSARNNLRSLELCFAAVASSLSHLPVEPGTIRKLM
ncbi:Gfo/Idh/MocA family protein [Bythopirellula polymerisocia]|uniref:Putative oxidoreductase YvaA n=1 Tax=Bythopirellula polymerisocia TaxID=2528003 RepID=A0A5C6CXB5_9BACT|nr:Gfo/Idh/MocA family oxidoreductase [Bythopirellula polymerisocia]TWU29232.1 putative oxidoreductase YvaA [Bythopirellula polymerisocia]